MYSAGIGRAKPIPDATQTKHLGLETQILSNTLPAATVTGWLIEGPYT